MDFIGKKIKHNSQEYKILGEDDTFFKCKKIPDNGTTYYFIKSLILKERKNEIIRKQINGKAG